MATDNDGVSELDVDRALHAAEREVWGGFLDATHEIRPRSEFARQLEDRLLASARAQSAGPISVEAQLASPLAARPKSAPWPPGLFRRGGLRLSLVGAGVGLAMVALLVVSVFLSGGGSATPSTEELMREFVPPGKVRHLVIEHTYSSTSLLDPGVTFQPSGVVTQNVWLTNGPSHLLMYTTFTTNNPETSTPAMWVTNDAVYDYKAGSTTTVLKYPYNPDYAARYTPDTKIITSWLELPNSSIVGYSTLQGRPVVEIATTAEKPATIPTPDRKLKTHAAQDDQVWLDTQTYQMVKLHRVTTQVQGAFSGRVDTQVYNLIVDELQDASDFPPDFFEFKLPEGAGVYDGVDPFAQPTATP
jgi:hypothetical protein